MRTSYSFGQDHSKILNAVVASLLFSTLGFAVISCENQREGMITSSDGSSIDYTISGSGVPTLVFVHGGLGCDKKVWQAQMDYFKDMYQVVALSLAGHGRSSSNRSIYTVESFGKDVASVVNELKLEKVILIGHSMGGLITIEAAQNLQNKVIGIIGLDCLNDFEFIWPDESMKGFLDWFETDTEEKVGNYIRGMFTQESDSTLVELTVNQFSSVDTSVFFSELENWMQYQNETFLSAVQKLVVPITVIQNGDNIIKEETNRKYNAGFTGVEMDSLLHFFIISYPELVNAEIESAIQGLLTIKMKDANNSKH